MNNVLAGTLYAEEREIERDSVERGVERYNRLLAEATRRGEAAAFAASTRLLLHWYEVLRLAIRKEKQAISMGKSGVGRSVYGPYMLKVPSEKLAVITMHVAVGMCLQDPPGPKLTKTAITVGRAVSGEYNLKLIRKLQGDAWDALIHTSTHEITPEAICRVARKYLPEEFWPIRIKTHLGACLLRLLAEVASVTDYGGTFVPAFEIVPKRRRYGPGYVNMFHIRREAIDLIREGHEYRKHMRPRYQPMVVPPIPWTTTNMGGYLDTPVTLIKRTDESPEQAQEALHAGINALNTCAWRVNKRVLDVMNTLWQQGGGIIGIPRMADVPMPPIPPDMDTNLEAKHKWKREARRLHRLNDHLASERVNFAYMADIAERFRNYERIYFPHQLDFRGRAYAVPLHMNHQGNDLCRGLLELAEARPLGASGLRWLQIHMANCCGVDKVSFDERVLWCQNNTSEIASWANDPLNNLGWTVQDKPLQALAAAIALNDDDAARHLPVQVDGSNNALQHYGAMLRCDETARLVNLLPGEVPSDVYADVAACAIALIAQDAQGGNATAKVLDGWVNRTIVKQTVMTSPYGVTAVGARRQIYTHLKDAGFPEKALYTCSRYLSKLVLRAVAQVCAGPNSAMEWLVDCAKKISATGKPVSWTGALGNTIIQPYTSSKRLAVVTCLRSLYVNHSEPLSISKSRQCNGFCPNFVHSLDAAHMMNTATEAHAKGIIFAGVHDAYWTHASSMDELGVIIRDKFVDLHIRPRLDVLRDDLCERYPTVKFLPAPETGGFDIESIRESPYFFA